MKLSIALRLKVRGVLFIVKLLGKWGWLEIGVLAENWSWWGKFSGFFRFKKEFTDYRELEGDRNK